jgi:hypothetical protein
MGFIDGKNRGSKILCYCPFMALFKFIPVGGDRIQQLQQEQYN